MLFELPLPNANSVPGLAFLPQGSAAGFDRARGWRPLAEQGQIARESSLPSSGNPLFHGSRFASVCDYDVRADEMRIHQGIGP